MNHRAAVEHVDKHGMKPLDRAIGCSNVRAVSCFLKRGVKLTSSVWSMSADKPDILHLLLSKLLEDGNTLYRVSQILLRVDPVYYTHGYVHNHPQMHICMLYIIISVYDLEIEVWGSSYAIQLRLEKTSSRWPQL